MLFFKAATLLALAAWMVLGYVPLAAQTPHA